MKIANCMRMSWVCAVVLAAGCVDDGEAPEEPLETSIEGEVIESDEAPFDLANSGEPTAGVGFETLNVTIPATLHAQGIALPAKLVRPTGVVGQKPAVLVLHGSGGLLKMGGGDPCSDEMEPQFTRWSKRLAELGYVVLLPSSYSARGFCDVHDDAARMPKTFDERPEQILGRLYDVDASTRYLCALKEVDCEHMGVMGFSQGGTMAMLAVHWQIEHAIAYFRQTKKDTVDVPIPDVKPGRPDFQVGVAYYPGCGFDGLVPLSTTGLLENKFSAAPPLQVLHGSKDPLVDHCSKAYGTGTREIQAAQVASGLKIANTYHIKVYSGASHGFDNASGTGTADATARDAALLVTLDRLKVALKP